MNRLDGFVTAARRRIRSGYYHTDGPRLRPSATFTSALDGPAPVIAELKARTPTQGMIFDGDPRTVLDDYVAGGAAGLSVLVDADHFDGSVAHLRLGHATGLPVLFKDFVLDPVQLACAQHHGCAAVLLIERLLEPETREALVIDAHARGLEVVLEVHDDAEWQRASASAADIIGVNARDLDTLHLDRGRQQDLLRTISPQRPVMSLSGIRSRADRVAAEAAGARGVLVGTMLMQHNERRLALKSLRRPLVKVCGLTREEDLRHAVASGADLVGFVVLSPDSPREISIQAAKHLARVAAGLGCDAVMVTRSEDEEAVMDAIHHVRAPYVQWHGVGPGQRARVASFGSCLFAAMGPGEEPAHDVHGFVLDNRLAGQHGGTGQTHDWDEARRTITGHALQVSLIAGGLDASNVAAALAKTGAWGADASSRLESAPGIKDPAKVKAYIDAAR